MQSYNLIIGLVSGLSEIESKILLRSIKGQFRISNRLLDMYEIIVVKKQYDFNKVINYIYRNENSKSLDAFRKLCERFLDVVFVSLVSHEIFEVDREKYSDIFYNRKWVRSRLNIMQVIGLKSIRVEDRVKFAKEIEIICRKFEFLEELILVLQELIPLYAMINSIKEMNYYENDLLLQSSHLSDKIVSDLYVHKFISSIQHYSLDNKSITNDIAEAIIHVTKLRNKSPLLNIQFNLLMLRLQYSHFVEDFEAAEKIMHEIIDITNNNVCLKYFSRVALNYMNLAYTQFFLGKFEEAYQSSLLASVKSVNSLLNHNLYRESGVFALIYLRDYISADNLVEDILSSKDSGNYPNEYSKRKLMHAFVKYLRGDYKTAFLLLQDTKEIESDREGWNLGIRMLNIYLTLSTEKVDLADQRIGSMRKHIERTSKLRNLRKRDMVIFRILSHLSRSGFDFKETWEERAKDFDLLRKGGGDYRWIPRSHELIVFDQWFEAKMNGKPYDPVFPKPEPSSLVEKKTEN